jgi:NAD(P)-dependent dehydrogenase (short-subunit alcohol dehydrogenase family)
VSPLAIVTGGGGGIGRAICHTLSQRGDLVVIADIDFEKARETAAQISSGAAGRAMPVRCDVAARSDVTRLFEEARTLAPPEILINAAGVAFVKPFLETSEEEWQRTLQVNLGGTWNTCHEFISDCMRDQRQGSIVNIASNNAFYAEKNLAAYCASKGGVTALTRALALEYGSQGVRVNAVCPGFVDTPLLGISEDDVLARKELGQLHAIGRIAQAAEVAAAACFLASPGGSFITGAWLVVDGGMSIGVVGV